MSESVRAILHGCVRTCPEACISKHICVELCGCVRVSISNGGYKGVKEGRL